MMVTIIRSDLEFILDQIKFSEQHANGTALTSINGGILGLDPTLPYGVRTVDGRLNNVLPGQTEFGAADTLFPRLIPAAHQPAGSGDLDGPGPGGVVATTYDSNGSVIDPQPRIASNAVVDQSLGNLAAIAAALRHGGSTATSIGADLAAVVTARDALAAARTSGDAAAIEATQAALDLTLDGFGIVMENGSLVIPNVAPDEGLSAPFNAWMTMFGQFFDHGLDLVTKGGNGSVVIPLQPDDPLFVVGGNTNFMIVTRATQFAGPGADGILGTTDDTSREAQNTTTSFVDQNQTYTSHASHQVFLREYALIDHDGNAATALRPVATGRLLDGANGGLPTWAEVKAQASAMLGITLEDFDIGRVPLILTDAYGKFVPDPLTGFAQIVTGTNTNGTPILASGTAGAPVNAASAMPTGHAFLDDIARNATPVSGLIDPDRNPATNNSVLMTADVDSTAGGAQTISTAGVRLTYDDELLDSHFITGDGRGNENIGLTSVHHIFHSEHNRVLEANQATILGSGDIAFINEWLLTPITEIPTNLADLNWNGERLFQAARFTTEMQYQHLVFEEFARKVSPSVNAFAGYDQAIDASIVGEFAHVVYRFGHSMLTETVNRLGPDGQPLQQLDSNGNPVFAADGITPVLEDMGLIQAFLNPLAFNATGLQAGGTGTEIADHAAGAVIRAMTRQTGNEIDEFVTGALRNNLLGLPLDLAAINMARAREQGAPTLNEARRDFYEGTAASSVSGIGDSQLKPYESWLDFAAHLKNPLSIVNFIAAYGTHGSIVGQVTDATSGLLRDKTLAEKRDAATALVLGGVGAPGDSVEFLTGTGAWANVAGGVTITGLDDVDLWLGGLAEAKMPFGGMLGSTFSFVFETQMEKLQDGDRFYYLARTAGLNFLTELEGNSFTSVIERNTDLGTDGMHLPGDIFSNPDHILEVDIGKQIGLDPTHEPTGNVVLDALNARNPIVARDNPSTTGPDANYLKYSGDGHVVLGGTANNDTLIGSIGDDTFWGDAGNDRLEGGAGNDILNGGAGDDIIQDTFGDDNFKGGDGNDAIHAGQGLFDLILAGDGKDFTVSNADVSETFGGRGDDFIFGGPGSEIVFGGEGNDWIEGGDQADLLQGDNGAPFQDSDIIGNDVIIGQGGNDDYDSESGDDIMVAGPGISRFEGMLGFDWVTYERDPQAANADLFLTGLLPPDLDANRDRYDMTEGVSGGALNDVIRGDNADSAMLLNIEPVSGQNNALNNAGQIALINGLSDVLGGATSFSGGNIILGGGGSDILEGRGGDDIIDGDAMLNVRLAWTDSSGATGFADSMAEIQNRVFAGEINPGDINIVREIVDGDPGARTDIDIAEYSGNRADYTVTTVGGVTTVAHVVGGVAGADGSDRVTNVEILRFADGVTILDPTIPNATATGNLVITNANGGGANNQIARFEIGDTLAVTQGTVVDTDGLPAFSTFAFNWQFEDPAQPGVWANIEDPITLLPVTGAVFTPTAAFALDGARLRVVGSFVGGNNIPESVASAPTAAIIGAVPVVPDPAVNLADINEDSGVLTITPAALLVNAVDFDTPLNLLQVRNLIMRVADGDPAPGILTPTYDGAGNLISATFTPALNFNGGITFTFDVSDGTNLTFAEANLAVLPVIDGPTDIAAAGIALAAGGAALAVGDSIATLSGANVDGAVAGVSFALDPGSSANFAVDTGGDVTIVTALADSTTHVLDLIATDVTSGDAISERMLVRMGSGADNIINGNAGTDIVYALGGNDTVIGGGGDDVLFGQDGADTLIGAAGADQLSGGAGDDVIWFDAQDTSWNGGAGFDHLILLDSTNPSLNLNVGAADVEVVVVYGGNDTINGTGATSQQILYAGAGNDNITMGDLGGHGFGQDGNDSLTGGGGVDILLGGAGADTINGGVGNDVLYIDAADSNNFDGGDGYDYAIVETAAAVNVSLQGRNIEVFVANNGDDTINASGATTSMDIYGFAGNDSITGGAGATQFYGMGGDDTIIGGASDDTVTWNASDGRDRIDGGGNLSATSTGDTFLLNGDTTAEAFKIYTRAAWLGISGNTAAQINSATEIVIIRNDVIIAELDNIEEININGAGVSVPGVPVTVAGDSIAIFGNFNETSLNFNTITINGEAGNDTIDISSLDSAHRIVFKSNGGQDTIIGTLRDQDVIELPDGAVLADYASTTVGGVTTLTNGSNSVSYTRANSEQPVVTNTTGEKPVEDLVFCELPNWPPTQLASDTDDDDDNTDNVPTDSDALTGSQHVIYASSSNGRTAVSGTSNTTLVGSSGDDNLLGNFGDDIATGGDGADIILTDDGNDTVLAGGGRDRIDAGAGDDRVWGGSNRDVINAGSGNDVIYASGGDGDDVLHGDTDIDTLDFEAISSNATIDLGANGIGLAVSDETGRDVISSIENVKGGSGDDRITLSNSVNVVDGGDGNDTFIFNTAAAANGDRIDGFQAGDKVDLRSLYASLGVTAADVATLDAGDATHNQAGGLKLRVEDGNTIIEGNTDADLDAEFTILVTGHIVRGTDLA